MARASRRAGRRKAAGDGSTGIVASPLLNLAPMSTSGATLRQVRPIVALGAGRISGSAILSLSTDRRWIKVDLQLDDAIPVEVRLRRLDLDESWPNNPLKDDLMVLEILPSNSSRGRPGDACLSLYEKEGIASLSTTTQLLATGLRLTDLTAQSISGMTFKPWIPSPERVGARNYLSDGLFREIAAAERSASAIAASRHVELATLYARQMRNAQAVAMRS